MTCIPPDDSTEPVDIDDGTQIDQNKKEKKVSFSFSFCSIYSMRPPCSLTHDDNDEPPPLLYVLQKWAWQNEHSLEGEQVSRESVGK
jgi:hypothetical protein